MPHEVNGFQCNYCHRTFYRMVDAHNHERACKYNPERRSCFTCKHNAQRQVWCGTSYGEDIDVETDMPYWVKVWWCDVRSKPISAKPYYDACETDNKDRDWNDHERPVPGTCWDWESKKEK